MVKTIYRVLFMGMLLGSNLSALTFEGADDVLSDSDLEDIMEEMKGDQKYKYTAPEEERAIKDDTIVSETSHSKKSSMFFGVGYMSSNIESVLVNDTGSESTSFRATSVDAKIGWVMENSDLFYYLNSRTLETGISMMSHEVALRWRLGGMQLNIGSTRVVPFLTARGGIAQMQTEPTVTSGMVGSLQAGAMVLLSSSLVIELGYGKNYTLWDYPIDGVVNYYDDGALALALEYRF